MLRGGLAEYGMKETRNGRIVLYDSTVAAMKWLAGSYSLQDVLETLYREIEEIPDIVEQPEFIFRSTAVVLKDHKDLKIERLEGMISEIFMLALALIEECSTIQKGIHDYMIYTRYFDRMETILDHEMELKTKKELMNSEPFDPLIKQVILSSIRYLTFHYEFGRNPAGSGAPIITDEDLKTVCNVDYLIRFCEETDEFVYGEISELYKSPYYILKKEDGKYFIFDINLDWALDRKEYFNYICHNNQYDGINPYYDAPLDLSDYNFAVNRKTSAEKFISGIHTLYDWIYDVFGPLALTKSEVEDAIVIMEDIDTIEQGAQDLKYQIEQACYFVDRYIGAIEYAKNYTSHRTKTDNEFITFDLVAASLDNTWSPIPHDHHSRSFVKNTWSKDREKVCEDAIKLFDENYESVLASCVSFCKEKLKALSEEEKNE